MPREGEIGEGLSVYCSCDINLKAICQDHTAGRDAFADKILYFKGEGRGRKTIYKMWLKSKQGLMDEQNGYQKRGDNQNATNTRTKRLGVTDTDSGNNVSQRS